MKKNTILVVVLLVLILLGALGYWQYKQWRQSFIEPVRMSEDKPGVFLSHPDNVMPDKKMKLPEGL